MRTYYSHAVLLMAAACVVARREIRHRIKVWLDRLARKTLAHWKPSVGLTPTEEWLAGVLLRIARQKNLIKGTKPIVLREQDVGDWLAKHPHYQFASDAEYIIALQGLVRRGWVAFDRHHGFIILLSPLRSRLSVAPATASPSRH